MWTIAGKRREMGLGKYPVVSLSGAREKADECRAIVADGGDPIAARDRPGEPTFGDCAKQYIEFAQKGWRNPKHKAQWRMTMLGPEKDPAGKREPAPDYCGSIREKRVSEISTADVLNILQPIWQLKHETASRIRGRIEIVLDYAKGKGWRSGENPAGWKGNLAGILKNPKSTELSRGHHAALPFVELPAFMADLRTMEGLSALALEFTILTGVRTGEALGAKWQEMDLEARAWTIPAVRMKSGKVHRVPLADRTIEILQKLNEVAVSDFVFPGQKRDCHLSQMSMAMTLRRMRKEVTVHGFRSTFRDWSAETTNFPREICELALAHTVAGEVERAYQRGDMFEKRRKLMDVWSKYCAKSTGNVLMMSRLSE
jgi:integrase